MRDEASKRKSAATASFVLRFDNHKSTASKNSSSSTIGTTTLPAAATRANEADDDRPEAVAAEEEEEPRVTIVDMRSMPADGNNKSTTIVTTRADVYQNELQQLPSTSSGIRHNYQNGVRSQRHGGSPENVMTTTTDPSITLQDEHRQTGKITPSSPRSNNSMTESSKSSNGGGLSSSDASPRDSASTKSEELEVPVTMSTLPLPESVITRVPGDHVDSAAKLKGGVNGGADQDPSVEKLRAAAGEHNGLGAAAGGGVDDEEERVDLNDIPFIVNCLYVTQQCCECTIM